METEEAQEWGFMTRTCDWVELLLAEPAVVLKERLEVQPLVGLSVLADGLGREWALELHHEAEHVVVVHPGEGHAACEELVQAAADGPGKKQRGEGLGNDL